MDPPSATLDGGSAGERERSREVVALELSAEDEARLRALGYLGADAGTESVEPGAVPN